MYKGQSQLGRQVIKSGKENMSHPRQTRRKPSSAVAMDDSNDEPVPSTSRSCLNDTIMDVDRVNDSDSSNTSIEVYNGTSNETECIKSYKKLARRINAIEINPESIGTSSKQVVDLLDESNKLAVNAYQGSSVAPLMDSDLMAATGRTVSKLTQALEIDSRFFSTTTFANSFKKFLGQSVNHRLTNTVWIKFSNDECDKITHGLAAPIISYMFGAVNFEDESQPTPSTSKDERNTQTSRTSTATTSNAQSHGPAPAKRARNILVIPTEKQSAALVNNKKAIDKVEKDRTVIEVERLYEKLSKVYEKFHQKPIPYLNLVVNEEEFAKTVENIFHFSFLVKEGYASIFLIPNGNNGKLTVVKPIPEEDRDTTDRQRSSAQVAFSFTEKTWKEWKVKLNQKPYVHFRA